MEWYKNQVAYLEEIAKRRGYKKVSQLKLAVAQKIKTFVGGGGFMFAMCSATDSYDIALDVQNTDICSEMFDYDPQDPTAQSKLDFSLGFAFENFQLRTNPFEYEYSNIDANFGRQVQKDLDDFNLFDFSAEMGSNPHYAHPMPHQSSKRIYGTNDCFQQKFHKKRGPYFGSE